MTLRELITWVGFDVSTANLDKYDRAVQNVMDTSTRLHSNLIRLADQVTQVGKRMTLGLSLPIAGVATAGVIATAKVEKFQTSFEVMLKSADRAKSLMGELFQFEAVTPFNLEQVMTATNKLLIAKEPVKNITNQLRMLGDVAAGDAQRLQSIVYVLGQVRALGYLQGQDIMQFTNALVPIRAAIAKVTGVEGKALQKMIEQRKITADMTQKALELIAKEREGMMAKQARTLGGLWSSLMSAIFRIRAAIGEMISETLNLRKILDNVIAWIDKLTKFIKNMDPAMKKVIVWMGMILFIIGPLLTIVGTIAKVLLLVKGAIVGMGLAGVTVNLTTIVPLLGKAALAIGVIAIKLIAIGAAIAGILIIAEDIVGYFTGKESVIIPALLRLLNWLKKQIADLFGISLEQLNSYIDRFIEGFKLAFKTIKIFFMDLLNDMKNLIMKHGIVNMLLNPVGTIAEETAGPATKMAEGISKWWNKKWENFDEYRKAGGKIGDIRIDIQGIHLAVPEGTPKQQQEALQTETDSLIKIGIIEQIKKYIVSDIQSGTRG
jgi:tape measure domain-containing protein